jgi:hypothetical protein
LTPNYVSGDIKLNKVEDSTIAVIEDANTGTGLIKIHIWAWAVSKNKVDLNKLQSQIQQSLGNEFENKTGKTSFNNDVIYTMLIKKKETVSENEMGEKKYDQSHGSPYDRGRADSWYRRPSSPHKWPEGTGRGEKVTDLTPEEIEAYEAGYEDNERHGDHKEWD